jgi:hypothetical protein
VKGYFHYYEFEADSDSATLSVSAPKMFPDSVVSGIATEPLEDNFYSQMDTSVDLSRAPIDNIIEAGPRFELSDGEVLTFNSVSRMIKGGLESWEPNGRPMPPDRSVLVFSGNENNFGPQVRIIRFTVASIRRRRPMAGLGLLSPYLEPVFKGHNHSFSWLCPAAPSENAVERGRFYRRAPGEDDYIYAFDLDPHSKLNSAIVEIQDMARSSSERFGLSDICEHHYYGYPPDPAHSLTFPKGLVITPDPNIVGRYVSRSSHNQNLRLSDSAGRLIRWPDGLGGSAYEGSPYAWFSLGQRDAERVANVEFETHPVIHIRFGNVAMYPK